MLTQPPAAGAPAAVRDTLAAVFADPAFDRSLRDTLLRRLWSWVGGLFDRIGAAVAESPAAQWSARVLLVLLALLLLGRAAMLLWAWRASREAARLGRRGVGGGRLARDPWVAAQEAAAAGRYTEAAHLLYQALLQLLAARERLRLHPSKTVGDYARELRVRSSAAFHPFRAFARDYERVVYGLEEVDREHFDRLRAAAQPLTRLIDG